MDAAHIETILRQVAQGEASVAEAADLLRMLPGEDLGFAQIDHHRPLRQGTPEVIYGAGKTPEQIVAIAQSLLRQQSNVLCTRMSPQAFAALQEIAGDATYHPTARVGVIQRWVQRRTLNGLGENGGKVGILSAGTTDLPVAEEAGVCAAFFGADVRHFTDVGVAGLHRLTRCLADLRQLDVAIVVAGMEGALPSVVGGLLAIPVIAVPTSVGYGASFQGLAALLGMLNSCAAGVTVVNIDNGFGAAAAAQRILNTAPPKKPPPPGPAGGHG